MNDLLKPLEQEYEQLMAEQAELDDLTQAIERQQHSIDRLEQAAEALLDQLHKTRNDA